MAAPEAITRAVAAVSGLSGPVGSAALAAAGVNPGIQVVAGTVNDGQFTEVGSQAMTCASWK